MKKFLFIILINILFVFICKAQPKIEGLEYAVSKSCYNKYQDDRREGQKCTEKEILNLFKELISSDQITDWEGEYFSSIVLMNTGEIRPDRIVRMPRWVGKGHEALIEEKLLEVANEIDWMPLHSMYADSKKLGFATNINIRIQFKNLLQQN